MQRFANFDAVDIKHAFSDSIDGNMSIVLNKKEAVYENRRAFLNQIGLLPEQCVLMQVEHGDKIAEAGEKDRGAGMRENSPPVAADAIVTREQDLPLMLLTGDCLPVVLHDPRNGILALAHMSRFNTSKRFAETLVVFLKDRHNANPGEFLVGFGPCIRKASYIFPADRVPTEAARWDGVSVETRADGAIMLDLPGENALQFVRAGVRRENIFDCGIDTAQDYAFFSHYRSRRENAPEGRFATVVWSPRR